MKFINRVNIAMDMCIHAKFKTILYMIEVSIFLALLTFVIYVTESDTAFSDRIEAGLKIPVEKLGYVSLETADTGEVNKQIGQIEGISAIGGIQCNVANSSASFAFLREIQGKHRINYNEEEYESSIETTVMSKELWNVMNIELKEGIEPSEYTIQNPDREILLYLSEQYIGYVNIGDVFTDTYKGKVIFRYTVAGFFDSDSTVIDPFVFSDENTGRYGCYSLDYGIIEITDTVNWNGNFIVFDKPYADVYDSINNIAAETDVHIDVYNISDVAGYIAMESKNNTFYLKEIAAVMTVLVILSITAGRVYFIRTRASDYGVWASCGASIRDLCRVIILQNIITVLLPMIFTSVSAYNVLRIFYTDNSVSVSLLRKIYFSKCMPAQLITSAAIIVLSGIWPINIIKHTKLSMLVKGKVSND